jgi:alanine racemase
MDMITFDVTGLTSIKCADTVELWGNNIPVERVAEYASTISYGLLAGLTARVKRVYLPA